MISSCQTNHKKGVGAQKVPVKKKVRSSRIIGIKNQEYSPPIKKSKEKYGALQIKKLIKRVRQEISFPPIKKKYGKKWKDSESLLIKKVVFRPRLKFQLSFYLSKLLNFY